MSASTTFCGRSNQWYIPQFNMFFNSENELINQVLYRQVKFLVTLSGMGWMSVNTVLQYDQENRIRSIWYNTRYTHCCIVLSIVSENHNVLVINHVKRSQNKANTPDRLTNAQLENVGIIRPSYDRHYQKYWEPLKSSPTPHIAHSTTHTKSRRRYSTILYWRSHYWQFIKTISISSS